MRERQFIMQPITRQQRVRSNQLDVEPPPGLAGRLQAIADEPSLHPRATGNRRAEREAPHLCDAVAPAFICDARPRGAHMTRSAKGAASLALSSLLPPSTDDHLGSAAAQWLQTLERSNDAVRLIQTRDDDR
jgi:hypothetical protein